MRFYCLIGTLLGVVMHAPLALANAKYNQEFDRQHIDELLDKHAIPRLEYVVISDHKLSKLARYGLNEHSESRPLFNVASLAKPVFSALVLKLVDKGLWRLDTPIADYWVDESVKHHQWLPQLTTRHILSHRSGFPNWRTDSQLVFEFEPGAKMQYSGEGFEYLQRALESHFNMSLEMLFDQHLKSDVPVKAMQFSVPNEQYEQRIARWFDGDGAAYPMHTHARPSAADNLTTTIEAYAKFIQYVMNGANLSSSLYQEMLSNQGQPSDAFQMGLGWEILDGVDPDGPVFLHSGSDKGVNTIAIFSVESGEALIIFTNSDNGKKVFMPLIKQYLSFGEQMVSSA